MLTEALYTGDDDSGRKGFHWSSIWAGSFVALAVWAMLSFLGLAIGFGVLEPLRQGAVLQFGVGTVIWTVIVQIVALFCGAFVASRAINFISRDRAFLHGAAVWGFTTIVATALGIMMMGAPGFGANAFGAMPGKPVVTAPMASFDQNATFGMVNARLREQGRPALTDQQTSATMAEAAAMSRGAMDAHTFALALSRHSDVSYDEARTLATQANAGALQRNIERGAQAASAATSRTFWVLFIASILSLLAAFAGGLFGSARTRGEVTDVRERPLAPGPQPSPPIGAHEVYP